MNWAYYLTLLVVLVAGLLINIISLPGLWLMVLGAIGYAWVTGFGVFIGWPTIIIIVVLATLAEIAEFIAGSAGAKSAGGSRRAMVGATVGGLLGGIFLTFLIPIPIVGSIIGALVGCFIGAVVAQLTKKDEAHRSLHVGLGAMKGRLIGMVIKTGFGVAILLVAASIGLPVHWSYWATSPAPVNPVTSLPTNPATAPSTEPSTAPATRPTLDV